jgi:hypothetical protein
MSDTLSEAQELYAEALDAMRDQRAQVAADLSFSDPSNPDQWDSDVRQFRENDPGGKRPCLVVDQCGQYVANVAGQVEQKPPSIHAIPIGGGADKDAAEQIDGRFRHIEHASRAMQHYARGLTSAARTGVGYLIVRPEVIDRSMNLQEPRISSEPDPLKVILDPWSTETDGSDAQYGYILTSVSEREFARRWPGKTAQDFGDTEARVRADERKAVLTAEQWYREETTSNMIRHLGEDGEEAHSSEDDYHAENKAAGIQLPVYGTYKEKKSIIRWRRMSGLDILEESEYPADAIGIVPIYGYVGFSDGRMRYCGIPRRARAAQQAYNYHISEELAFIATSPRAPFLASKRALRGVEAIWDRASVEARAYLPYNDEDEKGDIASPSRSSPTINLTNHSQGAERALHDIQASIGMYQASLGAPSNESSGVAIESRKQQGEASTAHFPSHLAASLGQVGKIVMQMDAQLSDTQRSQPILGIDGTSGSVTINPDQKQAFQRGPEGVSINPKIGSYGVRIVVGASYSTQRTQTNAAFAEIMRGNPDLAPTVAPFWAQTLDFPGSDKFAQAMAAMAPPPVKAILQPEGADKGPDPAELSHQLDQCKQALNEAIGHAHDAQHDANQAIAVAADAKRTAATRERELDIEAYNAETDRLKVTGANSDQIEAITRDLITQMLRQAAPLPGDEPDGPMQPMPDMQSAVAPPPLPGAPQLDRQVSPETPPIAPAATAVAPQPNNRMEP